MVLLVNIISACVSQTPLDKPISNPFSITYSDNIPDRFSVVNNEVSYRTFSESTNGGVCIMKFQLTESEMQQLKESIEGIDFSAINDCFSPAASSPDILKIQFNGATHEISFLCKNTALQVIYNLEEFTAGHEDQLMKECKKEYLPKFSYCSADDGKAHKVKESWEENNKACVCQSFNTTVCQ